eukprot:30677-Pelagococcus_subviridis.AAC.6
MSTTPAPAPAPAQAANNARTPTRYPSNRMRLIPNAPMDITAPMLYLITSLFAASMCVRMFEISRSSRNSIAAVLLSCCCKSSRMRPRSRFRSSFCDDDTFSCVYRSSARSFSHSAMTTSLRCFEALDASRSALDASGSVARFTASNVVRTIVSACDAENPARSHARSISRVSTTTTSLRRPRSS